LIPENFTAAIEMKEDGSYNYKYDGKAVFLLAAAAIKEKGSLPPKDDAALKAEAEKMSKKPEYKKVNYLGNGRYDLQTEESLKTGQSAQTIKIFSILKDKDDVYTMALPLLKPKEKQDLKSLGIKINGVAKVTLPLSSKVLSNNASKTPGFFSKSYEWNISSVEDQPSIRFTLK
jgi:hypothetical protein